MGLRRFKNAALYAKNSVHAILRRPAVGTAVGRFYRDVIPVGDCMIDAHAPFITPTMKADLFWGFYEGDEVSFVRKYLPSDRDVIELGSSLGVVTSHIARKLELNRRLICVEANQALIPEAKRNVSINAPQGNVRFIHGAIDYSHSGTTVEFSVEESQTSRVGGASATVEKIERYELSAILSENEIDEFSLVCDIEGAEKGLLTSDSAALIRCGMVIIELHASTIDGIEDLAHSFSTLGFVTKARSGIFGRGAVFVFERE